MVPCPDDNLINSQQPSGRIIRNPYPANSHNNMDSLYFVPCVHSTKIKNIPRGQSVSYFCFAVTPNQSEQSTYYMEAERLTARRWSIHVSHANAPSNISPQRSQTLTHLLTIQQIGWPPFSRRAISDIAPLCLYFVFVLCTV